MEIFKQYGISEKEFNKHKKILSNKFGQVPNDHDLIWSIFNNLITKNSDLHTLKMIYYQMALFLNEEGKDTYDMLKQSIKMELMRYNSLSAGIYKISNNFSC